MPAAIGPVITGIAVTLGALGIEGVALGLAIAIGIGVAGLSFLAQSMLPSPSLESLVEKRTVQQKSPVAPWRIIYGQVRVSGIITHLGSSNNKSIVHSVITIAAHQCQSITSIYLNENPHYYTGLTSDYFHDASYICIDGWASISLDRKSNKTVTDTYRKAQYVYMAVQKSLGTTTLGGNDFDVNGTGIWPDLPEGGSTFTIPTEHLISGKDESVNPARRLASWNVPSSGWERSTMWQKGHTKIYTMLRYAQNKFSSGYPNISATVEGKLVYTSTALTTKFYSKNPAWCILDYLLTPQSEGGMGIDSSNINLTSFNTAAGVCDEEVNLSSKKYTCFAKDEYLDANRTYGTLRDTDSIDNEILILDETGGRYCPIKTGDTVSFAATNIPYGLTPSIPYYVRVTRWESHPEYYMMGPDADGKYEARYMREGNAQNNNDKFWRIQLYTIREYAFWGESPVTLTGTSTTTGEFYMYHDAQLRYTCDGVVDTGVAPVEILRSMLTSMAGELYHTNGQWKILAGEWRTPVATFTEDDIVGPISIRTRKSASDRINAVKGKYAGMHTGGQPTDYVPVTNSTYLAEDDNVQRFGELDLLFTDDEFRAQRIAKIKLEEDRQQIFVETEFDLKGMQVSAGDNIYLTLDRYGWSAKPFKIIEWELITNSDKISIRVLLKETASGIYDWNDGEETTYDLADNSNLDDPFLISPPTNLALSVEQDTDNYVDQVLAKVTFTWVIPEDEDVFVNHYRPAYKLSSSSTWINLPNVFNESPRSIITALPLGTYDFRVNSVTQEGLTSDDAQLLNQTIGVVSPTPPDVTNFTGIRLSGFAKLAWDVSTEPTVLAGGKCVIRHDEAVSGATWAGSVLMAELPGNSEEYDAPLKTGTYFIKFKNNQGGVSSNASYFILTQDNTVAYGTIATISEQGSFLGDKLRTEVSGSTLQLGRK